MDFDTWYNHTMKNLGGAPTSKNFNPAALPHEDSDPRMKPLTLSPEVIEFMQDDAPIHCPHLQLLAGCMNCEYDELYKYCRCTKNGNAGPCLNVLNISNKCSR